MIFALAGAALLARSFAAVSPRAKVAEAETFANATSTTTVSDASASGGSYVHFDALTTPPSTTGVQPTRINTGPRYGLSDITPDQFLSSRTCNRQRITGDVRLEQQWMKSLTFTLTDCEITGQLFIYIQGGGTPLSIPDMPTIIMDYVDVLGGMNTLNAAKITVDHSFIAGSQWVLKDYWAPFISGPAPYTFSNSLFYGLYASQPTHTEALHVADYGSGYSFTNVAFVQQGGPLANSGVTATINFHGRDAVFDGCWFIWEGTEAPAYYTAYLDGINTTVRNSRFSAGASGYIYPGSTNNPIFSNNVDYLTGAPVLGP